MKKCNIHIGERYVAKVNCRLTVVRVLSITESGRFRVQNLRTSRVVTLTHRKFYMTDREREELKRCADQAQAHGRIEVARWYRIWAMEGKQPGPRPESEDKKPIPGGPIC